MNKKSAFIAIAQLPKNVVKEMENKSKDKIPGGLSKGKSVDDIAKKHKQMEDEGAVVNHLWITFF